MALNRGGLYAASPGVLLIVFLPRPRLWASIVSAKALGTALLACSRDRVVERWLLKLHRPKTVLNGSLLPERHRWTTLLRLPARFLFFFFRIALIERLLLLDRWDREGHSGSAPSSRRSQDAQVNYFVSGGGGGVLSLLLMLFMASCPFTQKLTGNCGRRGSPLWKCNFPSW